MRETVRKSWSKSVSFVRGLLHTEELGHGRGYHGMFAQWDAHIAKIRKELNIPESAGIYADSRASILGNIGVMQLASLPHHGQVSIFTDVPFAVKKFENVNRFAMAALDRPGIDPKKEFPPIRVISATQDRPNDFKSLMALPGSMSYASHAQNIATAKTLIDAVHPESILALELNSLNEAQEIHGKNANGQIGALANELLDHARQQGKRVVILHGLDQENELKQPVVALYSDKLTGTKEEPGEARIHAPLAGPVETIRNIYKRIRNPRAKARALDYVDMHHYHQRILDQLNEGQPRWNRLTRDDFGLVHTRAGFGGDQLTLAAGLFNGVLQAHQAGRTFDKVPAVMHLPNYWRVQGEYLNSANVEAHPVLADEFLNRNHNAFVQNIENTPGALVYLENPTNPQGRKLTPEAVTQVLKAANKSGSVVVEDMTLVNPDQTPEARLEHIHDMIQLANEHDVKYLAIVSGSKITGQPEKKMGAVFASREAKGLIDPFDMPISKKDAHLFDQFISKGFRAAETKEIKHMKKAYAWMKGFAAKPDTLHQLLEPDAEHLEAPGASSFKMFKLHLPDGMTVAELVKQNPQLIDFDPKPLQGLCGGNKPPQLPQKVWDEWATMYRLSPVSAYAIQKGVKEIEKAARRAWQESGVDRKTLSSIMSQRKKEYARLSQHAAERLERAA